MRKIVLTAAVLASLALTAPAQARTAQCVSTVSDGVRVELTAMGNTSCAFARSTARRVARLGYAPTSLTVYSTVTRRSYRIWRESVDSDGADYYSVTYAGPNGIRLRLTAYTL